MPDYTVCAGVREKRPLVHCISNIVTANDCANLLLACGASPMMAEAPEEMEEITCIADATVLNLGTPSREKYAAARICLEQSKRSGKPVVLDPVGVGAGEWRLKNAASLLSAVPPDIVRVNLAEAEALLGLGASEQGVDSPGRSDLEQRVRAARTLAAKLGCAVLLTGAKDVVSDGERTAAISGGSGLMPLVTGQRLYAQRAVRSLRRRGARRLQGRLRRQLVLEALLRAGRRAEREPRQRLVQSRAHGRRVPRDGRYASLRRAAGSPVTSTSNAARRGEAPGSVLYLRRDCQ